MKGCSIFQQYTHRNKVRSDETADTARGSSFTGYLKCNRVPEQSNLKIFLNSPVTKIKFDKDKHATGVIILRADGTKFIRATKEVILAGGAFDTPHILQVSGVGNHLGVFICHQLFDVSQFDPFGSFGCEQVGFV